MENLDTLPFPARHLFPNIVDYSGIHGQERGEGATTIISSRGCPFHCSFCTKIPQTSTVRFRQPDKILLEMKTVMDDYDVTHFRFVDDIFTLDSKRVEKFCELKSSEGNDATWICITRADALNTHLLKQMKDAGCREIHIGVESGSQRILDAMNKQTTVKTLRDAVTDIKKTGIRVKTYIMYGYPGETEKDREETIRFIREVKPDKVTVSEFTPIPGSLLWDECSTSDNWFYSDDNDEYNDFRRRCTELCE